VREKSSSGALIEAGSTGWRRNRLLSALPQEELERLAPHLELVELGVRVPLHGTDQPIEHVYFPLDCVVSMIATLDGDTSIEVSTIGPEGMAGLPAFLGDSASPNRTFCQVPGEAARLEVGTLREFTGGDSALHDVLHRYSQVVLASLAQNVACNRLHTTEERCARWLAQTHDRVGQDNFLLTQEFLGQMLGVRRATVSLSAAILQRAGLIRYTRGRITVLDPDGLRRAACGCYATIIREFAKLS